MYYPVSLDLPHLLAFDICMSSCTWVNHSVVLAGTNSIIIHLTNQENKGILVVAPIFVLDYPHVCICNVVEFMVGLSINMCIPFSKLIAVNLSQANGKWHQWQKL